MKSVRRATSKARPDVMARPTPIRVSRRTRNVLIVVVLVALAYVVYLVPDVLDARDYDDGDLSEAVREMTDGRGTDSAIEAVGMEAHGSPGAGVAQQLASVMPDAVSQKMMNEAGVDRLTALLQSLHTVRRGGTISLIGVYGGRPILCPC